jgi:hypothetical protein
MGHDNSRLGHDVSDLTWDNFLGRRLFFLALGRCFHWIVVLPTFPVLELELLGTQIGVASVAAAGRRGFLCWLLLCTGGRRLGLGRRGRSNLHSIKLTSALNRVFHVRTWVLTLPARRLNLPPSVLWKLLLLSGGLLTVFAGSFFNFEADAVGVGFTGVGFIGGCGALLFASSASTRALLKLQ